MRRIGGNKIIINLRINISVGMIMKRCFSILILLTVNIICGFSQITLLPNYVLKSHETLEINKIEITSRTTVIYMSIENRTNGGYFCADKNIFIIYPDGTRNKLTLSNGIPVCPNNYRFKTIGEKLDFTLVFSALKTGTEWIDLIEECADHCFSFYGINLDSDLNKKIDDAFALAETDKPADALYSFIRIAEDTDNKNHGIEGLLYINIIKLARETGNPEKASEWYHRMISSDAPGLSRYIKYLNDQGISY